MRHPVFAAIFAFSALAAAAPAQRIRLTNPASAARTQWIDVAVPKADAASLPLLCRLAPQGFPVLKGSDVGLHSTMFHVLASLAPHQSIAGNLVPVSNAPGSFDAFSLSDWIADSATGVIPVPSLVDSSGVEHPFAASLSEVAEDVTAARRVLHLRGRMGSTPIFCDIYLYVYACQDVVRVECTFTNSDPATSELSFHLGALWIETGEHLQIDYRNRLGLVPPVRQMAAPWHPSYGKSVQIVSGPRVLGRGEQIFVSGSILCMPAQGRPALPLLFRAASGTAAPGSILITPAERIETLMAAYDKPAFGVCLDWQGKWLAFGFTPELPAGATAYGWDDANASWSSFLGLLSQAGDLYDQRPRGLNRHAANTGAQEDFGACKGAFAVTVGDPRFLFELGYSVHEPFLRPFHYREHDGSPLRAANHPGLQTWSQIINCRTTQETVGLACPLPYSWPSDGWSAYDDQHRSQNNLNALLALTGSYSLRDQVRDLAEVDLTQVPNRMDSPRAEGRLGIAWANMLLLLDDPAGRANLRSHALSRVQTILGLWAGRNFVSNPQKPIRILETGSDPTFLEPNNTRVPAIIVWEHSIATMGFYALWRVTGDQRFHDLAAEISKVIVNHCIFQENGHWIACTAIRYLLGAQEGDALPASSYYTGSPDIHIGISFWTWILPSVLICRDLNRGDTALVQRCDSILRDQAPSGPADWQQAEWWAVLPR
ncbi:MAG: hypothetical protein Fur0037_00780 [Planctomycetota bacterium]